MAATREATRRAEAALKGKVRVNARVDAATRRLVQAYTKAWAQLRAELEDAAMAAAIQAARFGNVNSPEAYLVARLQTSLEAIERQMVALNRFAGVEVNTAARDVVAISPKVQADFAQLAGVTFNMPQDQALAAIVTRATQRIASDYIALSAGANQALRNGLLRGIAAGQGPETVARAIVREVRGAFGGGMGRALVIARTELLDASREATKLTYAANRGVVVGWRWLATLDARTCPACWERHNSIHPIEESLEGHQQCRCTQVPILADDRGEDDLGDPRERFSQLTRSEQLQVMGPRRLAYLDGGGSWDALSERRTSSGWRPSVGVTPLARLGVF